MRRSNAALASLLTQCVIPAMMAHADSRLVQQTFTLKKSDGTFTTTTKMCWLYTDPAGETCLGEQPWCATTGHSQIKLTHQHFGEEFSSQEKIDAERYMYDRFHPPATLVMPTTAYNCFAIALYGREDVWIIPACGPDPPNPPRDDMADDFASVLGTEEDPYIQGYVCRYGPNEHASIILKLLTTTNPAKDAAAKEVKAKWGGYGKYKSSDDCRYGDPDSIWKPKP